MKKSDTEDLKKQMVSLSEVQQIASDLSFRIHKDSEVLGR